MDNRQRIGSPPQVRGKPIFPNLCPQQYRITPAGAGKTTVEFWYKPVYRDHPRRCGENSIGYLRFTCRRGSPPQVRGKPNPENKPTVDHGITPAGAGKTLRRCRQSRQHRDHPRRCGENKKIIAPSCMEAGSPPQVRGKPQCLWGFRPDFRITPAGAGKTKK